MSLKPSASAPITCVDWGNLADEDGFLALGRNRYHCSYVIYTDGTYYYSENGTTGALAFGGPNNLPGGTVSGTNAAAVIQASINALPAEGGRIFVKVGTYEISTTISLRRYLFLEGENIRETIFRAADGLNADVMEYNQTTTGGSWIYLAYFTIDGNKTAQTSGHGFHTYGTELQADIMMERLFFWRCKEKGLYIEYGWGTHMRDCLSETNDGIGFHIKSIETYMSGCFAYGNGGDGYELTYTRFNVVNCQSTTNTGRGFRFVEFDDSTASNLYVYNNTGNQIQINACNNSMFSNIVVDANLTGTIGIQVIGTPGSESQRVRIINSIVIDANVGVNMFDVSSEDTYIDCDFINCATEVTDAGLRSRFSPFCLNYVVKNSGTATIAAAATAIVQAHGCSYTPVNGDIAVVLTNQPTNDIGDVWVDTIGAANFTINCRNVPGMATAIFAWTVDRV